MFACAARKAVVTEKESKRSWEPICKCALNILQDLHTKIDNGDISIHELHEVYSKKNQIHKLYSATVVDGKQWGYLPTANTIVTNMDQRLREHEHFLEYKKRLGHMLLFLNSKSLPGNLSLKCVFEYSLFVYNIMHALHVHTHAHTNKQPTQNEHVNKHHNHITVDFVCCRSS